ncbi:MAG: four-helix bundle copper-binding protein [Brevundimonas subvibrioides]|uniref:Four-helix bundle copper-binding protein n=1 Tax=Brevundimonas subvibrioides TaxID=74313 RepID=A0A258HM40_9CAUL|nr:four-helix bundle copper-binding protein [Brevundimonas subvibrioides]OYX58050.1 MAG: four-helix bundle copper-binding protein [Brevundimonas subvibrioides]
MHIGTMISSHLHVEGNLNEALVRAIEEANACAAICRICADACLGELMVADLVQSIRLDLDCADVCAATSIIGARRTGSNEAVIKRMLEVCAETCAACATECDQHAEMHEHCRICAEACRRCTDACLQAAGTITPKD